MRTSNFFRRLKIATVVFAVGSAHVAHAETITASTFFSHFSYDFFASEVFLEDSGSAAGSTSASEGVAGFDSSLGTLNSVTVSWGGGIPSSDIAVGIFVNGPDFLPGEGTVMATASAMLLLQVASDVLLLDSYSATTTHSGSIDGPPGPNSSSFTEVDLFDPAGSTVFSDAATLAWFAAQDTILFDLTVAQMIDVIATVPGASFGSQIGNGFALVVDVEYEFTPVPIPIAAVLFGSSLLSLWFAMGRRRVH